MKHPMIACALAGLTLACQPARAQTAAQNAPVIKKYGEVGGWTINTAFIDGQHMACSAVPPGARSAFELSQEGMTVLVPTTARGQEGDEVKGAYDLDGKPTKVPFYRRENDQNMAFIKEPHAKQMAAGKAKVMTVTFGKEKTVLPLAGFDAAYKKVVECTDKEGK